jgi:hypothetical protein
MVRFDGGTTMMALFWSWDFWYGLAVKWMGARAVQFG